MHKQIKKGRKRFRKGLNKFIKNYTGVIDPREVVSEVGKMIETLSNFVVPENAEEGTTTLGYSVCKISRAPSDYGINVSPDAVATSYMSAVRKCYKHFNKGFKHIAPFMVHEVVRQQSIRTSDVLRQYLMSLYGGLTTADEPRA